VVVGVHVLDGRGLEYGRGRSVSEGVGRHRAVDSDGAPGPAWGAIWMSGQIGAAISPLLVVPIQMRYGWQASFFVFGVLGVVWSLVWYLWFRDSPSEKSGVTASELQEIGAGEPANHGMPWALALRSGTLWRITAIGACYVYSLGFFQAWLQTYLVKGRGYTEAALVLSSLPYLVGACAN
jgi:MFS transporter, ACS family, glucarate transporter